MAWSRRISVIAALWPVVAGAQTGGAISGRVTNSVTGVGLNGVMVRVCPSSGAMVTCGGSAYQGRTDTGGAFRIAGLPDGAYALVGFGPKDGFTPKVEGKQAAFPHIAVSGESHLDLQMIPWASLRGRVLDPEGKPAAGVAVRLSGLPKAQTTGANGEFLFERVAPNCCLMLAAMPKPEPAAKDGTRVVTTYYPSVVESSQAEKISMAGVDAVYEIRLRTALARSVRGMVLGTDGKPAASARVSIVRTETAMVALMRGALTGLPKDVEAAPAVTTAADGVFAFPPVIEGEWILRGSALGGNQILSGSARVTVAAGGAAGDIQNVQIRLVPQFDVSVTADWGEKAAPVTRVLASFLPLEGQAPSLEQLRRPTSAPGRVETFQLSPGRYVIGEGRAMDLAGPAGFYAAAAMMDGRDVLGQVVELTGPASVTMIYKTGGGNARGTVEKGAGAVVVLMTDAAPGVRLGYAGLCDANGAFAIPDLPPGEYTAVAVPGPEPGDVLRAEFVGALAREGRRVKVEAGATAQVELRVALVE